MSDYVTTLRKRLSSHSLQSDGITPPPIIIFLAWHYTDVIMGTLVSQITCLTIVYSTVYSGADQRMYQGSTSLAFVPVNSPHKWPVTRKMFPFDDVIMILSYISTQVLNRFPINTHGDASHVILIWPVHSSILRLDVYILKQLNRFANGFALHGLRILLCQTFKKSIHGFTL